MRRKVRPGWPSVAVHMEGRERVDGSLAGGPTAYLPAPRDERRRERHWVKRTERES